MDLYLSNTFQRPLTSNEVNIFFRNIIRYLNRFNSKVGVSSTFYSAKLISDCENIHYWIHNQPRSKKTLIVKSLDRFKICDTDIKINDVNYNAEDYIFYFNEDVADSDLPFFHMHFNNALIPKSCAGLEITPDDTKKDITLLTIHSIDIEERRIESTSDVIPQSSIEILDNVVFNIEMHKISSWTSLSEYLRKHFDKISYDNDFITYMNSLPFDYNLALHIVEKIKILNEIEVNSNNNELTEAGIEIYNKHFIGKKADFSSENSRFLFNIKTDTANHKEIDCPWHGKINSLHDPVRIHFTWPRLAGAPIIVVYVGRKMTKK